MDDRDPKYVTEEFWRRSNEATSFSRLGFQIIAIIHGGALAGILASMGPSIVERGAMYYGISFVASLFSFGIGLLFVLFSLFCAYQSSALRAPVWNSSLNVAENNDSVADVYLMSAKWSALISILLFPIAFTLLSCAFLYS